MQRELGGVDCLAQAPCPNKHSSESSRGAQPSLRGHMWTVVPHELAYPPDFPPRIWASSFLETPSSGLPAGPCSGLPTLSSTDTASHIHTCFSPRWGKGGHSKERETYGNVNIHDCKYGKSNFQINLNSLKTQPS